MIVNLAEVTRQTIQNANLDERDVRYVIYHDDETATDKACTYSEFMDIAEEINYDDMDDLLNSRKMVNTSLGIVADNWWLRRAQEGEVGETWIYQERPKPLEELEGTLGELDTYHLIEEEDQLDEEYKELVAVDKEGNPYVLPSNITIANKTYAILEKDGVRMVHDKDTNKVAVIIGAGGEQYWTANPPNITGKDIRMLLHPELVKMVMEGTYTDTGVYNKESIENNYGITTDGFFDYNFTSLKVEWVTVGSSFHIVYSSTGHIMDFFEEKVMLHNSDDMISV